MRSYSMKDVAKEANVSLSTVSRVLNSSAYVDEKKREQVIRAAEKLNYNINYFASNLGAGYTHEIGVVIPDIANPFFADIYKGLDDAISLEDYCILLCCTGYNDDKAQRYINYMVARNVGGLILISVNPNEELLCRVKQKTNVVSIQVGHQNVDNIDTLNEKGMYELTEHVIRCGHTEFAFFGGIDGNASLENRYRGFRRALKDYDVPFDDSYFISCGISRQEVHTKAVGFLSARPHPTAVLCINDNTAVNFITAARQCGIDVPRQISVTGFDDIHAATITTPQLTTVAQPSYYMGQLAARTIFERINGGQDVIKSVVLETKLIVRDSVLDLNRLAGENTD